MEEIEYGIRKITINEKAATLRLPRKWLQQKGIDKSLYVSLSENGNGALVIQAIDLRGEEQRNE